MPHIETTDAGEREYRGRLQRALGSGYQLRELIGRGGFGSVYAAWDVKLEREVAVKALRHDLFPTSALLERFEREAKAVATGVSITGAISTRLVVCCTRCWRVSRRLPGRPRRRGAERGDGVHHNKVLSVIQILHPVLYGRTRFPFGNPCVPVG